MFPLGWDLGRVEERFIIAWFRGGFFFFFNDLEEKVNCMLMKFTDNIKLKGAANRLWSLP